MIINLNRINLFQNVSISMASNNNNNTAIKGNSNITGNQDKNESSLMKNLLKQQQAYKEEKQALAAKKMDAKEKKVEMDDLNQKIKDIDSQIQQLKVQEKQDEIQKKQDELEKKKAKEKASNNDVAETDNDVLISASLSELIKVNGSKETIHLLKDSKNRQTIEAEYIKPNNITNSYDNNRLSEISTSIANINMTISKKIGDLNKSAERIQAKTELAVKQIKDKNDTSSDKDSKNIDTNNTPDEGSKNNHENKIDKSNN